MGWFSGLTAENTSSNNSTDPADWPLREFTVLLRNGLEVQVRAGWLNITAAYIELIAYSDRNQRHTVCVIPTDMLEMIVANDSVVYGPTRSPQLNTTPSE